MALNALFFLLGFCFIAEVVHTQDLRPVVSIPCFDRSNIEKPIPISPSGKLFVMGEATKVVRVRRIDDPYHVFATCSIPSDIQQEEFTPLAFDSDSILLLLPMMSFSNDVIVLNVITRETLTVTVDGRLLPSKHGHGLVLSNYDAAADATTWSFFDAKGGAQFPFATGGPTGTILRNGDFLLQDGNSLKWYRRSTRQLHRVVTVPSQYRIATTDQFADVDEDRQRLYVVTENNKILAIDLQTGTTRELPPSPDGSTWNVDVSKSGNYLVSGYGIVKVFDVRNNQWRSSWEVGDVRNALFLNDSLLVMTTNEILSGVDPLLPGRVRALAVPWIFQGVFTSTDGSLIVTENGRVLDYRTMELRNLDAVGLQAVAGGALLAGRRDLSDGRRQHVLFDSKTLVQVRTFDAGSDMIGHRELLDCDIASGLTIEVTRDTTIVITNHNTQKTIQYRRPFVLQGRFRARGIPARNEAIVQADGGGEILSTITARRVLPAQLVWGGPSADRELGIRCLSSTVSSMGDLLVGGFGSYSVLAREEIDQVDPTYVDINPYRFYGFTPNDKVAFVTHSGEYVLCDKHMNFLERIKITDTITTDSWWAHLSYSGNRLLIADANDRIDVYDVSGPVSVDSEGGDAPAVTNVFWPSSTTLTLPGTVVSIHDELGRDQRVLFMIHPASDGSTLSTSVNTRGLFIVRMADGTARLLYCE